MSSLRTTTGTRSPSPLKLWNCRGALTRRGLESRNLVHRAYKENLDSGPLQNGGEGDGEGGGAGGGAGGGIAVQADRSAWLQVPALRSIAKWEEELESAHEFMQLVREELLGSRVFVFTEAAGSNTRILNLARGATLQEAASALNASATRVALLNGTPRRGSTELKNGDIISFVLERADVEETLWQGGALSESPQLHVCERCLPLPGDRVVLTTRSAAVQQQGGAADMAVGGTLHRADCECLSMRRDIAAGGRLVRPTPALEHRYREKLERALRPTVLPGSQREVWATKIIVFTSDRPGLLLTISSHVTEETVNIVNVRSETRVVGDASAFCYTVHISGVDMVQRLVSQLEELEDVRCVLRADMDDLMHDLGPDGFWAAGGCGPPPAS